MAFKLTKYENEQRDQFVADLEIAGSVLHAEMEKAQELVAEANEIAAAAIAAYNETLASVREFSEDIASRLREELEGKSERYQESDKGQAALEFVEAWENEQFDDIEWTDIDPPEQPDPDYRDTLENLPDAIDG